MKRMLRGLVWLAILLAVVACGSDSDAPASTGNDKDSGEAKSAETQETDEAVDLDELSFLTFTPVGISEVGLESGDETELISLFDMDLGADARLTLPRISGELFWAAAGPGRLIAVSLESGELAKTIEFDSTDLTTDFHIQDDVAWVQVGIAFADAKLLAVDAESGNTRLTIEAPPGSTIGGFAVGEDSVWLIGGDPETASAISRVNATTGLITDTYDAGLVVDYLIVGLGSVWAAGDQFAVDGAQRGAAVARFDAASGDLVATIEIGHVLSSISSITTYNGSVWVSDVVGPDFSGAQLHEVELSSNSIVSTFDVGEAGYSALDLVAGNGYIFASNHTDRLTYLINVESGEEEGILTGPSRPFAVRERTDELTN